MVVSLLALTLVVEDVLAVAEIVAVEDVLDIVQEVVLDALADVLVAPEGVMVDVQEVAQEAQL